jgi:selenocysteine lyase/cysteine desulfurase
MNPLVRKEIVKPVPLWEYCRDQFPVQERLTYLNTAAVSPLCRAAADAMKRFADDALEFGSLHWDHWVAAYEGLRAAAARLMGAEASEIAIVKNTSEGISTIAVGLDWKPGDRMVAFREEFPSNFYPWKRLEQKGVQVIWLSVTDSLDRIDEACRGARLLSISFVQYLSGYRAPLAAIGEICRRHNCLYMVDAIQGLGAFPLNVRACGIHALAADGHKWMMGPEGCGILYIARDLQDRVEPFEFGWTNVAKYADYASRDMALRPDAGRYECGSLNTIGCFGLRASLEFILEVGVEEIASAVTAIADRLAAGVRSRGYELCVERAPETAAGIVSFRKQGVDAGELVRKLRSQAVIVAPRQGWIRSSPHFYINPKQIDEVVAAL